MSKNTRSFELKLGRAGLMVFILGVSFSLLVSFVLGVVVGRHLDTYPEKIAGLPKQMVEYFGLRERVGEREKGGISEKERQGFDPPTKMAEGEERDAVAVIIEENQAKDGKQETGRVFEPFVPIVEIPRKSQEPFSPGTGEMRQQTLADGQEAALEQPVRKEPREKGPVAPPTINKYVIQLSSFREREKAERLCERIIGLGYKPQIETVESSKTGTWFRVVIMGYKSREEAMQVVKILPKQVNGINCVIRKLNGLEKKQ